MKQIFLFSIAVAAAVLVIGCAPTGPTPEQMITEAKAVDQRFFEAYNNGDVDGLMATYWNSPDLVSYPPGELEIHGWDAVKESFAKGIDEMKGAKLEFIEPGYKVAGDVVLSWGKWRWTSPPGSEPAMEFIGRYTDVKAMRDGKMVYIMDHASAPMPPPPDSPASDSGS